MCAYLWDLVDEGLDASLDLLQGRVGLAGVCVPVATGPVEYVRFAREISPRVFHTPGGVLIQPDRALYEHTRCGPAPADWLRTRNPFEKLSEGCRQRGLRLRARIDYRRLGRIAARDPHFACKNVFGDVSSTRTCPINPDVAEFVRALGRDLSTHYTIDAIEISGVDAAVPPTDPAPDRLGAGGRALLDLCFCESCKQTGVAAGVDVAAAARSVTVRLDSIFRTGAPIATPLEALVSDDPPLASFLGWHREVMSAWITRLSESWSCRLVLRTSATGEEEVEVSATDRAPRVDALVWECGGWELETLDSIVRRAFDISNEAEPEVVPRLAGGQGQVRGIARAGPSCEIQVPIHPQRASEEQDLVRVLRHAAGLGIAGATLHHLGCMPRDRIDAVKQAVRFAGRTTS